MPQEIDRGAPAQPSLVSCTIDGPIARLRFERPEKLNALIPALLAQACDAIEAVGGSPDVRVLIVSGAGRAFSVGVDLDLARDPAFDDAARTGFVALAHRFQTLLEEMPQVVIAQVRGYCLTGGLELAIAADLIVAADSAIFGDTHAKVGFLPRWGMPERLPRLIGPMRAREMVFTSRQVSGGEAKAIGLVLDAVPDAMLDDRVDALARDISQRDARVVAGYKRAILRAMKAGDAG